MFPFYLFSVVFADFAGIRCFRQIDLPPTVVDHFQTQCYLVLCADFIAKSDNAFRYPFYHSSYTVSHIVGKIPLFPHYFPGLAGRLIELLAAI